MSWHLNGIFKNKGSLYEKTFKIGYGYVGKIIYSRTVKRLITSKISFNAGSWMSKGGEMEPGLLKGKFWYTKILISNKIDAYWQNGYEELICAVQFSPKL